MNKSEYLEKLKSTYATAPIDKSELIYAISFKIANYLIEKKQQDLFKPLDDLGKEYFSFISQQYYSNRICCENLLCQCCCDCCGYCRCTILSRASDIANRYTISTKDFGRNRYITIDEHWKYLKFWNINNLTEVLECKRDYEVSRNFIGYKDTTTGFNKVILDSLYKDLELIKVNVYNILAYQLKVINIDEPLRITMI